MNSILNKLNRITNSKFFIALFIFLSIIPMGIVDFLNEHLPMTIIRLLLCLLVLIKYIPYLKESKKIVPMTIVATIYCLGRFIITYICSHNLISSLSSYSLFTIIILFMFVECTIKNNTKNLIEGVLIYCEVIIYINFICLLFPKFGSFFDCGYILQNDNNHFVYYALALTVSSIFYYINKDKKTKYRTITLWLTIIFCSLYSWSATTIVALAAFFFVLFISYKFKIANTLSYIITYYILFFGIVIFRIQNLFSFLIVDILHKDLTFSLRTYLWDSYINTIAKSPIIGYGYNAPDLYEEIQEIYLYAHNHILQELYNGGIIMYFIYCFLVILPCIKLWKNRDNKLSKVLSAIIFAILIHGLCESLSTVIYTFIFCLIYYIDVYAKETNHYQRNN